MSGKGTITALTLGLLIALLSACGGNTRAPVEDRQGGGSSYSSRSGYTVQRGDTLYSIAFRYGLDYRRLAAANSIAAPYTIYPGQRLQLREADPPRATASRPTTPPSSSSSTSSSSKTSTPASSGTTVTKASPKPATKPVPPASTVVSGPVSQWRWPSQGKVVRGYSSTVHKGIDIGGKRGDPVVASAAGHVVYAGNGIVGLGELLIVKHNEVYLTAYGHNERLLVSEGDNVRAGQKIAEKGSSGTDRVSVHFEIRKGGKPIDPLRLLPKR